MAKLITETSYDFQLHEDKNSKDMFIVGIFSTAEMENNNKRKYGREILEREIGKIQNKISKNCLWGELGHPPNPEVNPDKIALKIENLEWKGNNVYGKAKLLDTPMGAIAKTLVKEGSMGISSRGLGTVSESGYVNEDFNLITYDLVTDPSNKPSWVNGIYEGTEFAIPGGDLKKDPSERDIKEAQRMYFNHLMDTLDTIEESILIESISPDEMDKSIRRRSIINKKNPEWGSFGIMDKAIGPDGKRIGWELHGRGGGTVLLQGELKFWDWYDIKKSK